MAEKPSFSGKFLDCDINKHRPLGIGSYGAVYEATYKELPCAAKVIHRNLFEPQSHQKLLERFEWECELLRTIRHPCIVQFLGVARDPETRLPVLVMELMEESLTKFLERSDTELPIYLQVNFCHDVTLALAYLHSRDITHRDLSSNNVLLIAGTRVKVTDFGTSVFKSRGRAIMTSCPGTQAYMAPECFGERVQYSQSIDCFSFGVLAVQIITRKFPNPSSRLDQAPPPRSLFNFGMYSPKERYMRVIPEVDRRQNHLSLVSKQNPLRLIFMDCLNDNESARPSARDLCRNLAAIKEGNPLYKESIDNATDYQFSVIQQCDATRDELQSTTSELRKTRSEIDDYRRENEKLLLKNQSLEKQISELGQRNTELEIQILDTEQKQRSNQGRGRIKGLLFGDKDKEALDKSIQELREIQTQKLSLQKKVTALQTELEQNRRDITSKDRELREKSDRLLNLRDKMDALEVDLSLERIQASSFDERVKELEEITQGLEETNQDLEETIQDLEESKETLIVELKQQMENLKESTELEQETLEVVCCEEITMRDEKIKEQSRKIEKLKKSNKLDQENLEVVGREEISLRDEKLEEQRREIELLKRQIKKIARSPDRFVQRSDTNSKKSKQSHALFTGRRSKKRHSEDIHQLNLDSISLSDDSEDPIGSLEDGFEAEKQPAAIDDSFVHLKKEWPSHSPVSSRCSKLESYTADSEDLFSSAKQHSPSLISGNCYSDNEEFSHDNQYCSSSLEESGTIINDFDAVSSKSTSPDHESLQVSQDHESSPCNDDSIQPSSTIPLPSASNQDYGPSFLYALLTVFQSHSSGQPSFIASNDLQSPLDKVTSEQSDHSTPQPENELIQEQSCEEIDCSGMEQQSLHSEVSVQENTSPITKTNVQDQESQTTTEHKPAQLQNLNRTSSNPPQDVVTSARQTQHQSTLPSGAAASPCYEGVSQEVISSPVSEQSRTVTSAPQCPDVDNRTMMESLSGSQPLHQSEQQLSANYNIMCALQSFLQHYISLAQTGQLQSGLLGQPYAQTTNEQQQREHQVHAHPPLQSQQSQAYPPQMHLSQVQLPSTEQTHIQTPFVQPTQPPIRPSQVQPPPMEQIHAQAPLMRPTQPQAQGSEIQPSQVQPAPMKPFHDQQVQSIQIPQVKPSQEQQVHPSQAQPTPVQLVQQQKTPVQQIPIQQTHVQTPPVQPPQVHVGTSSTSNSCTSVSNTATSGRLQQLQMPPDTVQLLQQHPPLLKPSQPPLLSTAPVQPPHEQLLPPQVQPSQPPQAKIPQAKIPQVQPAQVQSFQVQPPPMQQMHLSQVQPTSIHQQTAPLQLSQPPPPPVQPPEVQPSQPPPQLTPPVQPLLMKPPYYDHLPSPPVQSTQVLLQSPQAQQVHPSQVQPTSVQPSHTPPIQPPQTQVYASRMNPPHDQVSHSTSGHTQHHHSQSQTAAQGSCSTKEGGGRQSLSAKYGLLPQVSAVQSEQVGNGPFYPQSSGGQYQMQNQAQPPTPQLLQFQMHQGHAGQLQLLTQSSQITFQPPQQTVTVQGPQQPHTPQGQQQHVSSVGGSEAQISNFQTPQSQLSPITQSHDSHVPKATYNPPNNTLQTQLLDNQILACEQHYASPPPLDQAYVQQNGSPAQQTTGKIHVQSPEEISTPQVSYNQGMVQASSRPQYEQPQVQLSQPVHPQSPPYAIMCSDQMQPIGVSNTYESSQPYSQATIQQAKSQTTSMQGSNQLPSQAQSSHPVQPDYSNPMSPGQSLIQHSAVSPNVRRPGGLYSSNLPTLHEETPAPTRSQWQGIADSGHDQHPTQPHPPATKQQTNLKTQYTQQQNLAVKQDLSNPLMTTQLGHYNQNLINGSQQTNMLDKTQKVPMENTNAGENENSSFQHIQAGQSYNPDSVSYISQQQGQVHPDNSRANVPMMASNASPSNPPPTQPEYINMQGGGGTNENSRHIPLPQTQTFDYKESGQGRFGMHTAPVGIHEHYNMRSVQQHPLSLHQPQPVYNQSNMQTVVPSKPIGASAFNDGQSAARGNVLTGYYGATANQLQPKAKTAPQLDIHSTTEHANNVSLYRRSQSDSPNASRGATAQYEQYQNQGLPMNVQPKKQCQSTRAGQSHAACLPGDTHPAGSNSFRPIAQSSGHPYYGPQSSVSSEESSISSRGNHPSPQSSIKSQMFSSSSKHYQQAFNQDQDARGARHPVHNQDEMAAQQMHRFPSSGSEHAFSGSTTHAYSPSEMESVTPHIAAERKRAQHRRLGYFPLPEQSLRQPIQVQRIHRPPDRREYHRSDSTITYPKHRSEPSMYRPPRGRRRRRPPRSHRTAPVVFFLSPQPIEPYDPYYGYDRDYESHHYRYTEQHYPEDIDEDDDYDEYDDGGYEHEQGFGYQRQPSGGAPRHTDHHPPCERKQEFGHQQQPSGAGPRFTGHHSHRERNSSESSSHQISCQTSRQTSSKSDSGDSVSLDSPRLRSTSGSGPADTYPFITQQKDEQLIQELGRSVTAEEYSVVLIQPQYVDDLNSPWTSIFAVCRRHPNCINALLDKIQGPSGSKYSVAHISILFDSQGSIRLDIPKNEAEKQGYVITTSVEPCMIWRSEATPSQEGLGPHADAIYPPRHTLTIYPSPNVPLRQELDVKLKLIGAKDCVQHFVLKNPFLWSQSPQNATRPLTQLQYTHLQPHSPPVYVHVEQMDALQSEPDSAIFLRMVGDRIPHKWRALGSLLGVPQNKLEQIAHTKEQLDTTCCSCVVEVVDHWKSHLLDRPSTWNELIVAVKNLDETLAFHMKHQLISGQMSTDCVRHQTTRPLTRLLFTQPQLTTQSSGGQHGMQNQAQPSTPQLLQSQLRQGHAGQPLAQPSQITVQSPQQTVAVQGPQQPHTPQGHNIMQQQRVTVDSADIGEKHHQIFNVLPSVSTYYKCSSNIASVPFLSQVEVLTCDSFGCEYYNPDHGVILRIPNGSIPPGLIAHLEVAVALYGPFHFSNGSCPISPILWMCIQESINLRKPIDIILPHFLTDLSNKMDIENLGVSFAKADHKQCAIDKSHYVFKPLETPFVAYKERSQSYGILSTQHCCFFCITSNNPVSPDFAKKAGYFLWCIEKPFSYSSPPRSRDTLLFCATFCLPTCIQALKSQYTEKDGYYFVTKPKPFRFKDPGDDLEPYLLIKVEHKGCVMAANPENKQIKASQIYFWDDKHDKLELLHMQKVYPPSVELMLEVLESQPICLLVKFSGSTTENDMDMEIMLPLASVRNSHPGSTPSVILYDRESQWITTDKPELSTLLKELLNKVACKWENFGILLKIEPHSLESVKIAENNIPQNCLREMLKIWQKQIFPPPSWTAIVEALQYLGDKELAHYLRSKYLK